MNRVVISGNLCKDIELKKSMQNKSYIAFSLGVREYTGSKERPANFIDFKAFGASADTLAKYLHKGDYVIIMGRLERSSYTNKNNQKVYTTDVIVEDFEFAPKPKKSNNPIDAIVEPPQAQGQEVPIDGDLTDEDLPF